MIFILPGILIVGFITLAIWWLFFRSALRHERTVQAARQREADFERLLATPGEPLFCVACQNVFPGPLLAAEGCPTCHTGAFVIPARTSDNPRIAASKCPPVSPEDEAVENTEERSALPVREGVVSSPPAETTVEQRIAK